MKSEEARIKARAYSRAYAQAHPEWKRAKDKKYREAHRAQIKAKNQRWRLSAHGRKVVRAISIKFKYGLTKEAYDSMLAGQNHACAICGSVDWGHLGPVIDHDHRDGKIRGILCFGCNAALGILKDDSTRMRRMADYLESK